VNTRDSIREAMPEIDLIEDAALREGVIRAWEIAIDESSLDDIEELAGEPEVSATVSQVAHQRAVARMALAMALEIQALVPEFAFNRDVLIAGALVHDVGKAYEYDPARARKWRESPRDAGYPAIRHPAYGVHVALSAGLPEEIAHICASHASEGEHVERSLEATLVHFADFGFWEAVAKDSAGVTLANLRRRVVPRDGLRPLTEKHKRNSA
jgi:putative nucleotidyltransferase with HDIG domain